MKRPLVLVEIAMHPKAEEILSTQCEITKEISRRAECDAVITYTALDSWLSEDLPHLKVVACHSSEPKFERWAQEHKVSISLVNSLWRTVAEHTVALMMSITRNIPAADLAIRKGEWQDHSGLKIRFSGHDFQNKTVGIWGLGQIGYEIAQMLSGFRMNIIYHDILPLVPELQKNISATPCTFDELLSRSDYFIAMVPLNEQTKGLLGKKEFEKMKKGCILINAARAGIIDETAFVEALGNGTLLGAAIDVQWDEPLPAGHPFTKMENLVMTPHLGGSTFECDKVLVDAVMGRLATR